MAECNSCSAPRLSGSEYCNQHRPEVKAALFGFNYLLEQYGKACAQTALAQEDFDNGGSLRPLKMAEEKEDKLRQNILKVFSENIK